MIFPKELCILYSGENLLQYSIVSPISTEDTQYVLIVSPKELMISPQNYAPCTVVNILHSIYGVLQSTDYPPLYCTDVPRMSLVILLLWVSENYSPFLILFWFVFQIY